MNFIEAIKEMKQGKKVRLPCMDINSYLYIEKEHILHNNNNELRPYVKFIESDEWEIVEENKTLWDKKISGSGLEYNKFLISDVKKSLKDILDWHKTHCEKTNKHENEHLIFKYVIKEKFGKELIED